MLTNWSVLVPHHSDELGVLLIWKWWGGSTWTQHESIYVSSSHTRWETTPSHQCLVSLPSRTGCEIVQRNRSTGYPPEQRRVASSTPLVMASSVTCPYGQPHLLAQSHLSLATLLHLRCSPVMGMADVRRTATAMVDEQRGEERTWLRGCWWGDENRRLNGLLKPVH